MRKWLFLLLFGGLLAGGMGFAINTYLNLQLNISEAVIIEIKKGSNLTAVAQQMSRSQIISYPRLLVKMGQFLGYSDRIKYGEFELAPTMTYRQFLEKIVSGESYRYSVTFVEGDHMYQYAQQLESKGLCSSSEFLKWTRSADLVQELLGEKVVSLEGYLFPDTYQFSKNDGCRTIVATMVKRFFAEVDGLPLKRNGLDRHQVITLASIIEKETGAGFERPMISSVFHNRLKKKMRLQTDPTIIYGILHTTGKEIKNIRTKDIRGKTPYNTYVIKGLPPGPIGNPGIESVKAAIKPAATQFLYFVSQNDGTHVFSQSYEQHKKAVQKFQLNPEMRKGKSWRDLKQKRVR